MSADATPQPYCGAVTYIHYRPDGLFAFAVIDGNTFLPSTLCAAVPGLTMSMQLAGERVAHKQGRNDYRAVSVQPMPSTALTGGRGGRGGRGAGRGGRGLANPASAPMAQPSQTAAPVAQPTPAQPRASTSQPSSASWETGMTEDEQLAMIEQMELARALSLSEQDAVVAAQSVQTSAVPDWQASLLQGPGAPNVTQPRPATTVVTMPSGWRSYLDRASGNHYYHNASLGETTWVHPGRVAAAAPSASSQPAATAASPSRDTPRRAQKAPISRNPQGHGVKEAASKCASEKAAKAQTKSAAGEKQRRGKWSALANSDDDDGSDGSSSDETAVVGGSSGTAPKSVTSKATVGAPVAAAAAAKAPSVKVEAAQAAAPVAKAKKTIDYSKWSAFADSDEEEQPDVRGGGRGGRGGGDDRTPGGNAKAQKAAERLASSMFEGIARAADMTKEQATEAVATALGMDVDDVPEEMVESFLSWSAEVDAQAKQKATAKKADSKKPAPKKPLPKRVPGPPPDSSDEEPPNAEPLRTSPPPGLTKEMRAPTPVVPKASGVTDYSKWDKIVSDDDSDAEPAEAAKAVPKAGATEPDDEATGEKARKKDKRKKKKKGGKQAAGEAATNDPIREQFKQRIEREGRNEKELPSDAALGATAREQLTPADFDLLRLAMSRRAPKCAELLFGSGAAEGLTVPKQQELLNLALAENGETSRAGLARHDRFSRLHMVITALQHGPCPLNLRAFNVLVEEAVRARTADDAAAQSAGYAKLLRRALELWEDNGCRVCCQVDAQHDHTCGHCWEEEDFTDTAPSEEDREGLFKAHCCDMQYAKLFLKLFGELAKCMFAEARGNVRSPLMSSGQAVKAVKQCCRVLVSNLVCSPEAAIVAPPMGTLKGPDAAYLTCAGRCVTDTLPLEIATGAVFDGWLPGLQSILDGPLWDEVDPEETHEGVLVSRLMHSLIFRCAAVHVAARRRKPAILEWLLGTVGDDTSFEGTRVVLNAQLAVPGSDGVASSKGSRLTPLQHALDEPETEALMPTLKAIFARLPKLKGDWAKDWEYYAFKHAFSKPIFAELLACTDVSADRAAQVDHWLRTQGLDKVCATIVAELVDANAPHEQKLAAAQKLASTFFTNDTFKQRVERTQLFSRHEALRELTEELARGRNDGLLQRMLQLRLISAVETLIKGSPLLLLASASGAAATVRLLLDAKASAVDTLSGRRPCGPAGETALHVAAQASALPVVEVLLGCAAADEWLAVRNKAGLLPLDCVDKSKKSASAKAAKEIGRLLRERIEQREKKQKEEAKLAARRAAAAESRGGAGEGRSKAGAATEGVNVEDGGDEEEAAAAQVAGANSTAAAAEPEAQLNEAEKLRELIVRDSAELTRNILSQLLRTPERAVLLPPAEEVPPPTSPDDAVVTAPLPDAAAATDEDAEDDPLALPPPPPPPPPPPAPPPRRSEEGDDAEIQPRPPPPPPPAEPRMDAAGGVAGPPPGMIEGREDREAASEFEHAFEDMPWRVLIVRPAARSLSALSKPDQRDALRGLRTLAQGMWHGRNVKHLSSGVPSSLSLYEYKMSKASRIVWSVGIDFVPMVERYQQTIRVWAVDKTHDAAQKSIERAIAIHKRGLTSVIRRNLRTRVHRTAGSDVVLPKTYEAPPAGAVSMSELERLAEGVEDGATDEQGGEEAAGTPEATGAGAVVRFENTTRYPPAVEQEDAYNLVKFYNLDCSLVYNILAATFTEKLEFPFVPDETEHLIINLAERRSVLLIGRSGTGKTTIVVQRMWLKYRTHFIATQERPEQAPLHQLFVTANPILRNSVAKSFKSLQTGWHRGEQHAAAVQGNEALAEDADGGETTPRTPATPAEAVEGHVLTPLAEVPDEHWPLFLRSHHWLRLLDGTLPPHRRFFTDAERETAAAASTGWHSEAGCLEALPELGDSDDESDSDGEEEALPHKGGARGGAAAGGAGGGGNGERGGERGGGAGGGVREEVTFDVFERWLWPLMVSKEKPAAAQRAASVAELRAQADAARQARQAAKEPLKPSVVFREIVSFIKGSSEALDSPMGHLTREEYLGLGKKIAPTFAKEAAAAADAGADADEAPGGRGAVYRLYLKYEAWKVAFALYDVMDACHHIHAAMAEEGGFGGPRIDEVFVDEVQDFTQAELRLFLDVCRDKNALFFTGDTCQTIARGVGFRFEELTTMFHHAQRAQQEALQLQGTHLDDLPRHKRVQVPTINKLTVNYRTHNGILGAASELVDILLELFPHSVDALERDRGHFDGPKPLLLTGTADDGGRADTTDLAILLLGSDPTHSQIEFGAHQAVLVRSQAAKERLPAEFRSALVLTIFEAKGLEFDDVFIFDFFSDSPADERTWRVVTGCLDRKLSSASGSGDGSGSGGGGRAAEPFDAAKHSLLNEELKMFYTAVTRARVKVVIFDRDAARRNPIFSYMLALDLAQTFDSAAAAKHSTGLAVHSTPHEWRTRARNLLDSKLYAVAATCFAKGGDAHGVARSLAMQFLQEAGGADATRAVAHDRLCRAARCFGLLGSGQHAVGCLKRAGEHQMAAEGYHALGQPAKAARQLGVAAEKANDRKQAVQLYQESAKVWEETGRLTRALAVRFGQRELHAEATAMLARHQNDAELLRVALPHLVRQRQYAGALAVATELGKLGGRGSGDGDGGDGKGGGGALLGREVDELASRAALQLRDGGDRAAMLDAVRKMSTPGLQLTFLRSQGGEGRAEMIVALLREQGRHKEACDELLTAGLWEQAARQCADADDAPGVRLAQALGARASDDAEAMQALLAALGATDEATRRASRLTHLLLLERLLVLLPPTDGARPRWCLELIRQTTEIVDGCEAGAAELREECQALLRAPRTGQPRPTSPGWLWLCGAAGRKTKELVLAGSDGALGLAAQAAQAIAWSVFFSAEGRAAWGARSRQVLEEEAAEAARGKRRDVCSAELSVRYADAMLGELELTHTMHALGKAVSRLGRAAHYGGGLASASASASALRGVEHTALRTALFDASGARRTKLVGQLVLLVSPEAGAIHGAPGVLLAGLGMASLSGLELSGRLPASCHPDARRHAAQEIAASDAHRRQTLFWFQAWWAKLAPTSRQRDPSHVAMACHVLGGLCNMPSEFDRLLRGLEDDAKMRHDWFPSQKMGRLGLGHIGRCLLFMHREVAKGRLLEACWPCTDYLAAVPRHALESGFAPCATACVELLEYVATYSLTIIAQATTSTLWLPHSLAALLPAEQDTSGSERPGEQAKKAVGHLRSALQAALQMGLFDLQPKQRSIAAQGTWGLTATQRAAVVLLSVFANRLRLDAPFSLGECASLCVAPLRSVAEQCAKLPSSAFAATAIHKRVAAFGKELQSALEPLPLHYASASVYGADDVLDGAAHFFGGVRTLLGRRHDGFESLRWIKREGVAPRRVVTKVEAAEVKAAVKQLMQKRTNKSDKGDKGGGGGGGGGKGAAKGASAPSFTPDSGAQAVANALLTSQAEAAKAVEDAAAAAQLQLQSAISDLQQKQAAADAARVAHMAAISSLLTVPPADAAILPGGGGGAATAAMQVEDAKQNQAEADREANLAQEALERAREAEAAAAAEAEAGLDTGLDAEAEKLRALLQDEADEDGDVFYEAEEFYEEAEADLAEGRQQRAADEAAQLELSRRTLMAEVIQRAWRDMCAARAAAQAEADAEAQADPLLAMHLGRLQPFEEAFAEEVKTARCLFCAEPSSEAHMASPAHAANVRAFQLHFAPFCRAEACPLLARLDRARERLEVAELERSVQPTERMHALSEIERSHGDLQRQLDRVEAAAAWATQRWLSALEPLRITVDFGKAACAQAEELTGLQPAEAQEREAPRPEDAAAAEKPQASWLGGEGGDDEGEGSDDDDDDDDDEDNFLADLARRTKGRGRRRY